MKVKEIAFFCYPVTDFAQSRKFYENVLGLKPSRIYGGNEGDKYGFAEYDIGPTTLAIGYGSPELKPSPQGASVALEVEDFDEAIQNLIAAHAVFVVEPQETQVCRMAVVTDPDGSQIMIHKRKS